MKYLRVSAFISLMFFIGCESITEAPVSESPSTETNSFSKVTLPEGAIVENAVLHIYVTEAYGYSVDIHPVLESWNELQVTWNSRESGVPWSTAGGHIGALAGSFLADNTGWKTFNMTALVNGWLDGADNNGILLKAQNPFESTSFLSSDYNTDANLRPKLVLTVNNGGSLSIVTVQRNIEGDVFDSFIDQLYPDATQWDLTFSFESLSARIRGLSGDPDVPDYTEKRSLILFDIDQEDIPDGPGTGTPGYWKNHPDAWPVEEITIGGVTFSKDEAIEFMQSPVKKDKTFNLFMHLVSAKLNLEIGNDGSCVSEDIDLADEWMADNGPVGSGVRANSSEWQEISDTFTSLDEYNNGWLCAPHRD